MGDCNSEYLKKALSSTPKYPALQRDPVIRRETAKNRKMVIGSTRVCLQAWVWHERILHATLNRRQLFRLGHERLFQHRQLFRTPQMQIRVGCGRAKHHLWLRIFQVRASNPPFRRRLRVHQCTTCVPCLKT
uniref:Uncharacterized protein n=1 Tax=Schistocephalus solidus TaxID=70667 RepID=A0A0X3PE13_SCHSO